MFAFPEKNFKICKISFLVTIIVGQSPMQFFQSLLFKNDRILRNDDFKQFFQTILKDSTTLTFQINLSFSNYSYLFIKLIQFFNISD